MKTLRAVFVGGTWSRKGQHEADWLDPAHSRFQAVCALNHVKRVHADRIWSTREDGLIVEDVFDFLKGHKIDGAWKEGGNRLGTLLDVNDDVDLIISHSHGAQVVAMAALVVPGDKLTNIRWLAIDPPVRREKMLMTGYMRMMSFSPRIVQTISATWDCASWPRWAGARRFPWDRRALPGAFPFDQPNGHSDVLRYPYSHYAWWQRVLAAVHGQSEEGGQR